MRIIHLIREYTVLVEILRLLTNEKILILPRVGIGADKILIRRCTTPKLALLGDLTKK